VVVLLLGQKNAGARRQGFRQLRFQFEGAVGGGKTLFNPAWIPAVLLEQHPANVGNSSVSQCEVRIEFDGALEHLQGKL
jgi:hypothetical protein